MSRAFAAFLVLLPSAAFASEGAAGAVGDVVVRIVNVALLLGVLWYFGRKPISAFFRERRMKIEADVEASARLRAEAEERHAHWQRKLANLDAELDQIRATARDRAEVEGQRVLEDARASAERIRRDARSAIDQELRRAREELRREASDLSVELAGDLLRRQVTDADRDRLLDEFIAKIEPTGDLLRKPATDADRDEQPASGSGS